MIPSISRGRHASVLLLGTAGALFVLPSSAVRGRSVREDALKDILDVMQIDFKCGRCKTTDAPVSDPCGSIDTSAPLQEVMQHAGHFRCASCVDAD